MYQDIIAFDNLLAAYSAAKTGKRYRREVVEYTAHQEERLLELHNHLVWRSWRPGRAKEFTVLEPKMRKIQAPPFPDRIVHHALVDQIEGLFDRRFIHHSYACRKGKGVHQAVLNLQRMLRQARREWGAVYVIQADVRQYFASIYHSVAIEAFERVIECPETRWLYRTVLNAYGHDDGMGLPVGALSSQLTANVVLDGVDHEMTDDHGAGRYLRYMDDIIILQPSKADARRRLEQLQCAIARRGLALNPKTQIRPASAGVDWCGYRTRSTHIRPRRRNIKRAKARIAKARSDYHQGKIGIAEVQQQVHSLLAYAKHCDAHRTIEGILERAVLHPPASTPSTAHAGPF